MRSGWRVALVPGSVWLACLYLAPLMVIVAASVATPDIIGRPVYGWDLSSFQLVFQPTYLPVVLRTFGYAAGATVVCLLIGYPCAYAIARYGGRWKTVLLLAVLVPWLADYLVRLSAWVQILGRDGPLNRVLSRMGADDVNLLGNPVTLMGGLVYSFLPFMILAIYLSVEQIDDALIEAAHDLYATPRQSFRYVVLPTTMRGVAGGCQIVFLLCLGDFAVAQFLGGSRYMMGNLIRDQLATAGSLPFGAALTVTLLAGMLALLGSASLTVLALRSIRLRLVGGGRHA